MQRNRANVLSIAGFDPCGGAGILADSKTFEQLKVYGMSVITANTIQTEDHFTDIHWQEIELVVSGIKALMGRYEINVVKIGIVRDFEYLKNIVNCVKSANLKAFIIWDPVLKSSSGFQLCDQPTLESLPYLMECIDLITPNYEEYQLLKPVFDKANHRALFLKGGHRQDQIGTDVLMIDNSETVFLPSANNLYQKHGSGCVLSSAIAAYLASGKEIQEACRLGKLYVEQFLKSNNTLLGYHHND